MIPQFNWSVLGPIVAGVAAAVAGIVLLVTHVPHMPPRAASAATAHAAGYLPVSATQSTVRLQGRVIGTPHLRPVPSSTAKPLRDLQPGETVEVSGCSDACGWYLVTPAGQTSSGWVSSAFIMLQGDERRLANMK